MQRLIVIGTTERKDRTCSLSLSLSFCFFFFVLVFVLLVVCMLCSWYFSLVFRAGGEEDAEVDRDWYDRDEGPYVLSLFSSSLC